MHPCPFHGAASSLDALPSSAATRMTRPPSSSSGMTMVAFCPLLSRRPLQPRLRAAARVNLAKHQLCSHDTLIKPVNASHCPQDEDTGPLYFTQQGPPTGLVPASFSHFTRTLHLPETPASLQALTSCGLPSDPGFVQAVRFPQNIPSSSLC